MLINTGNFYMHPENQCQEGDGIRLQVEDKALNMIFKNKYGKPNTDQEEEIREAKEKLLKLPLLELLKLWWRTRKKVENHDSYMSRVREKDERRSS